MKNLDRFIVDGILIQEVEGSLYLYSQKMEDHIQYGIVATCHCEEYECGNIKIHEKTRKLKEEDRIRYVDEQNANKVTNRTVYKVIFFIKQTLTQLSK